VLFALASRRDVIIRALRTALLVGVILVVINHGDSLASGELDSGRLLKILLTFAVPYCVSTYSSVAALRGGSAAAQPEQGEHP
jgi:hypothetical protein